MFFVLHLLSFHLLHNILRHRIISHTWSPCGRLLEIPLKMNIKSVSLEAKYIEMRSDSRLLSIVIAQDPKYISCILVTINGLFCLFKHEFEKRQLLLYMKSMWKKNCQSVTKVVRQNTNAQFWNLEASSSIFLKWFMEYVIMCVGQRQPWWDFLVHLFVVLNQNHNFTVQHPNCQR